MAELVAAIWTGPFPAELVDGRTLQPGDEALVTRADLESSHWQAKPKATARVSERRGDS